MLFWIRAFGSFLTQAFPVLYSPLNTEALLLAGQDNGAFGTPRPRRRGHACAHRSGADSQNPPRLVGEAGL